MSGDRQTRRIFAVGGAHIDRRGTMNEDFVAGASIPGSIREDIGGGAFNAMRNAVQRGIVCSMMSVRGADAAGEQVAASMRDFGIADLSAVFLDRATPSYTALVDRQGDVVAGLADMKLYDIAFPKQMRRSKVRECVEASDAVFLDANLPAIAIETVTKLAGGKSVYGIAISPAKAMRLSSSLARFSCLFMNMREARVLAAVDADGTMIVEALRAKGLRSAVITSGAGAIFAYESDRIFRIEPPISGNMVDATGAGDALAGTTTASLIGGMPFADAVGHGIAAALLTVESANAVARISDQALARRLAQVVRPEVIA